MTELNHILIYNKRKKVGVDIDYIEQDGKRKILAIDKLNEGDLNV